MADILLVIGNGFDRRCGLASSFKEFMDKRLTNEFVHLIEKFDLKSLLRCDWAPNLSDSRSDMADEQVTAWDIIFWQGKNETLSWADVELNMFKFFRPEADIPQLGGNKKQLNFDDLATSIFQNSPETQECNKYRNYLYGLLLYRYKDLRNFALHSNKEEFRITLSSKLSQEIRSYEKAFGSYLVECLQNTSNYQFEASNLFEKLVSETYIDVNKPKVDILSFNYTEPLSGFFAASDISFELSKYENVHGVLGQNIIIGFDYSMLINANREHEPEYENAFQHMTKTYRKLIDSRAKQAPSIIEEDIQVIVFYGHSLAKADWSYFQAIFDKINLYNGKTRLLFAYSNYDNKQNSFFNRSKCSRSLFSLLSKYGETLSNKDHGKNLIHKLILEGRLMVVEI
jgi:hypothetical protein